MTDYYCVFGNPVHHSKSPLIHAAFARQTGEDIRYTARLAPLDGFALAVHAFIAGGGRGANITVPFKEEAFRLVPHRTPRAEMAGAVNTLVVTGVGIVGHNTDGIGLLRDLTLNLGCPVAGKRVLLLGAGGAARGVIGPLLETQPETLVIANRTVNKAKILARNFAHHGGISGCGYAELAGQSFDIVINATSASLVDSLPPLPTALFAPHSLAYEMMYGLGDTPFICFARSQGAEQCADGIGMLVEQAAEAFYIWRGVRPQSGPVIAMLRNTSV
ncbi:shikimate dehydrogenase [Propionivibrio sp.]|uniref:shikimate dehydrogenase n=1 Tax=Propionivibrio sp. TaxID=2212460 RepID=UPI0025EDAD79|nr:shikimate dehydrogenase [Propionivibrio sp.]MBL0206425.1 shikimate dehydrogenase [Propionivibrio sp.]